MLRQHQAFPDNWRWGRFIWPGVGICALAIFIPEMAGLIPFGIVLLGAGLLALVVYMVWQRWGWRCYVLPDAALPRKRQATVQASGGSSSPA